MFEEGRDVVDDDINQWRDGLLKKDGLVDENDKDEFRYLVK